VSSRLEHYELAVPVWMAAKFKFPEQNLLFRKGRRSCGAMAVRAERFGGERLE